MQGQFSFDIRTPASHLHDPATSHRAESDMHSSGLMETHNKTIAWWVARFPGQTASEYWAMIEGLKGYEEWDLQEVRRRLTTIKDIHAVQGESRMGLRKKQEVTWWPK